MLKRRGAIKKKAQRAITKTYFVSLLQREQSLTKKSANISICVYLKIKKQSMQRNARVRVNYSRSPSPLRTLQRCMRPASTPLWLHHATLAARRIHAHWGHALRELKGEDDETVTSSQATKKKRSAERSGGANAEDTQAKHIQLLLLLGTVRLVYGSSASSVGYYRKELKVQKMCKAQGAIVF